MLRRQVRQRKEYLFQKHLEHREQATFEKKNRLRDALESNKSVPHDLRGKEGLELRKKLDLDDDVTKGIDRFRILQRHNLNLYYIRPAILSSQHL